jgi:hypothetical protein
MYEAGDTVLNLTAYLYRHPEARVEAQIRLCCCQYLGQTAHKS